MGYYIHCPKCGEETLDDGTLMCCNDDCRWYQGKDEEEKIAAMQSRIDRAWKRLEVQRKNDDYDGNGDARPLTEMLGDAAQAVEDAMAILKE